MMRPSSSFWLVLALNCLQNSMMLTCAWPRAGPTGGAGVALPAAIWSFTCPVTFFAMFSSLRSLDYFANSAFQASDLSDLLDLSELELHRSGAPEDGDHDLEGLAVFVHFIHDAGEVGERAFGDLDRLVLLELHAQLRLVFADVDAVHDGVHFFFRQRRGIVAGADEAGDARRGLHHVPHVIAFATRTEAGEIHLDQDVSRQERALDGVLLAVADLGDGLGRNDDAADLVLQSEGGHARLERPPALALEARVRVDDVPLHVRFFRGLGSAGYLLALARRSAIARRAFRRSVRFAWLLLVPLRSAVFVDVFSHFHLFREVIHDPLDAPGEPEVHQPKVNAEQRDRDEHHHGGGLHFFQRRRGDLLHLRAHVGVEATRALRPRLDLPAYAVLVHKLRC